MEEVQMRIMETGADKPLAVIDHRRGGRCGGNYVIGRTDCDDAVARWQSPARGRNRCRLAR